MEAARWWGGHRHNVHARPYPWVHLHAVQAITGERRSLVCKDLYAACVTSTLFLQTLLKFVNLVVFVHGRHCSRATT